MHVKDIIENEFQHVVNYEKQGKDMIMCDNK